MSAMPSKFKSAHKRQLLLGTVNKYRLIQPCLMYKIILYIPTYNGKFFADGNVDANKSRQNTKVDNEINTEFYLNNKSK